MARSRLILAFLAIYLIWGSTYYAIRVAVESIPPLAMMGARCLAAGLVLYAWSRLPRASAARVSKGRDAQAPGPGEWRAAFVAGGLLFLGSHGALAWAEQRVASGEAALLGATTPLWLALVDWRWGSGRMPGALGRVGLALGFVGVALLVAPEWGSGGRGLAVANAAIVGAAIAWAAGSVYGRGARLPRDVRQSTALQLLAGAVWLAAASAAAGEWRGFSAAAVTPASAAALLYLTVFGSVVAFTAYVWLLRATTASRVGTHAYINPIVAVALGAAIGGERVTALTVGSALTIVAGVVLVLLDQSRPHPAPSPQPRATSASPRPLPGATEAAAATRLA
jgi:drug/metabolite transporter (DMT)-like permease